MNAELARLQVDAMRVPSGHVPSSLQAAAESGPRAVELARSRGFDVLGRGTTRLAIDLGDGTVAKVSHNLIGLALNLNEAAVWETMPPEGRQHLTPCLHLSPQLILTQTRVEVLGPALVDESGGEAWLAARDAAKHEHADEVYACRAALGLGSDPALSALRTNNHGRLEGRCVVIDYGDQFRPHPAVWARLLGDDRAPTGHLLAERAGLTSENTDACPCYCGGTFAEGDPDTCGMDSDVAAFLAQDFDSPTRYPDAVPTTHRSTP